MARGNFVCYLRVSTDRQGSSGLGIEAQRKAVEDYLDGGSWTLRLRVRRGRERHQEGRETEAPGGADLLQITGAQLVIAKLDRLARNVAFISNLMESGVDFVAVDFPQANRLTVHILAAVAEHEAEAISTRTKEALAAAKAKGVQIGGYREPGVLCKDGKTISKGTPTLGPELREAARRARKAASHKHAQELAPTIADLRSQGVTSLRRLARALEERGVLTASEKDSRWTPMQVSRVSRSWRRGDEGRRRDEA